METNQLKEAKAKWRHKYTYVHKHLNHAHTHTHVDFYLIRYGDTAMQSKVHVSRSNRAFLSPTRENGSGSRTEKGAIRAGNVDLLCIAVSP